MSEVKPALTAWQLLDDRENVVLEGSGPIPSLFDGLDANRRYTLRWRPEPVPPEAP